MSCYSYLILLSIVSSITMDFGNNGNMIHYQQGPNANAFNKPIDHASVVIRMSRVWETLKIQLCSFNRIVVIPIDWYNGWQMAEKQMLLGSMV